MNNKKSREDLLNEYGSIAAGVCDGILCRDCFARDMNCLGPLQAISKEIRDEAEKRYAAEAQKKEMVKEKIPQRWYKFKSGRVIDLNSVTSVSSLAGIDSSRRTVSFCVHVGLITHVISRQKGKMTDTDDADIAEIDNERKKLFDALGVLS